MITLRLDWAALGLLIYSLLWYARLLYYLLNESASYRAVHELNQLVTFHCPLVKLLLNPWWNNFSNLKNRIDDFFHSFPTYILLLPLTIIISHLTVFPWKMITNLPQIATRDTSRLPVKQEAGRSTGVSTDTVQIVQMVKLESGICS